MSRRRRFSRKMDLFWSWVLSAVLVTSMFPVGAFAEASPFDDDAAGQGAQVEQQLIAGDAGDRLSDGNPFPSAAPAGDKADVTEPEKVEVRFDANVPEGCKATGEMKPQEAVLDDAKWNLAENSFAVEGYGFAGWSTTKDGKDVEDDPATKDVDESFAARPLYDGQEMVNLGYTWEHEVDGKKRDENYDLTYAVKDHVVVLYAQWEKMDEPKADGDGGAAEDADADAKADGAKGAGDGSPAAAEPAGDGKGKSDDGDGAKASEEPATIEAGDDGYVEDVKSDDGIAEVPGSVLLQQRGLAKATLRAAAADPAVPASSIEPTALPITVNGTTVETARMIWTTDNAGQNRLSLAPQTDDVPDHQWQLDVSLSGKNRYEAGAIEITVPAYIWSDRDGAQTMVLDDDHLSVIEMGSPGSERADWVWQRIGDNIVITNNKSRSSATSFYIQGHFGDCEAHAIVDGTVSNAMYATVAVTTKEGDVIEVTSNAIDATIDTYQNVAGATKTAYSTSLRRDQVYMDGVPSELPASLVPADAQSRDYVYVKWYVAGNIEGNQPAKLSFSDTIADEYDGVMLGAVGASDEVIPAEDGTVSGMLLDGYSANTYSAYIWTAYPMASFPNPGEVNEMHNTVTMTAVGWDDELVTTMDASATAKVVPPYTYTVTKAWDDDDDAAGYRPDGDVTIWVWRSNQNHGLSKWKTVTLNEANNWTASWHDTENQLWDYQVSEFADKVSFTSSNEGNWSGRTVEGVQVQPRNYTRSAFDEDENLWYGYRFEGTSYDAASRTYTVSNKLYTKAPEKHKVVKEWIDGDDADKPASMQVWVTKDLSRVRVSDGSYVTNTYFNALGEWESGRDQQLTLTLTEDGDYVGYFEDDDPYRHVYEVFEFSDLGDAMGRVYSGGASNTWVEETIDPETGAKTVVTHYDTAEAWVEATRTRTLLEDDPQDAVDQYTIKNRHVAASGTSTTKVYPVIEWAEARASYADKWAVANTDSNEKARSGESYLNDVVNGKVGRTPGLKFRVQGTSIHDGYTTSDGTPATLETRPVTLEVTDDALVMGQSETLDGDDYYVSKVSWQTTPVRTTHRTQSSVWSQWSYQNTRAHYSVSTNSTTGNTNAKQERPYFSDSNSDYTAVLEGFDGTRDGSGGEVWTPLATITRTNGVVSVSNPHEGVTASGSTLSISPDLGIYKTRMRATSTAAGMSAMYDESIDLRASARVLAAVDNALVANDDGHTSKDYGVVRFDNHVTVNVYDSNGDKVPELSYPDTENGGAKEANAVEYLHARNQRVGVVLEKNFKMVSNDKVSQQVKIHADVKMTQQSNVISSKDWNEALEDGTLPLATSGIWYDLVPEGMLVDMGSIQVGTNDVVEDAWLVENYGNSGRTLLCVKVNLAEHYSKATQSTPRPSVVTGDAVGLWPDQGYRAVDTLSYDCYYPWREMREHGVNGVRNVAAFESDGDRFGNLAGLSGEPDDPSAGKNILSMQAVTQPLKDLATDLDTDRDDPSFVYAGADLQVKMLDFRGTSGLIKQVAAVGDDVVWGTGSNFGQDDPPVNVYEDQAYMYKLTAKADSQSVMSDIVIVDKLEAYKLKADGDDDEVANEVEKGWATVDPDTGEATVTTWQGRMTSIDLSELSLKGIDAVFYWTDADVDVDGMYTWVDVDGDGTDNSGDQHIFDVAALTAPGTVWHEGQPTEAQWPTVKAVAVDCRRATADAPADNVTEENGERWFKLQPDESVSFIEYMRAPQDGTAYFADSTGDGVDDGIDPVLNAHAYNNGFLGSTMTSPMNDIVKSYVHADYTKVGIMANELTVRKAWDDDGDRDAVRPASVHVQLYADGQPTQFEADLSEANGWEHTFRHVPVVGADNNHITYTYVEDDVNGYAMTNVAKDGLVVTFTNTHVPETVSIPVEKAWIGDVDEYGTVSEDRPASVTVDLYADGVKTGRTGTLSDANGWSYSFSNMYKYDHGVEIAYTVVEREVAEGRYTTAYSGDNDNLVVTNTYHPYGDLTVTKTLDNASAAALAREFTMTFAFSMPDGSAVTDAFAYETSDGRTGTVRNGQSVTLRNGQSVTVSEIPHGVRYMVVESGLGGGVRQVSDSGNNGSIKANAVKTVDFVNAYSAKGSWAPVVNKGLDDARQKRYQFRFQMEDADGNVVRTTSSVPDSGVVTATLPDAPGEDATQADIEAYEAACEAAWTAAWEAADGHGVQYREDTVQVGVARQTATATFGSLSFTDADDGETYTYIISEVDRGVNGFTYDSRKYKVDVTVHDAGDGTLTFAEVWSVSTDNGETWTALQSGAEPWFENDYAAQGEIALKAWKDIDGYTFEGDDFDFAVKDESGQVVDMVHNDANGNISFGLQFDQDDIGKTYLYTLSEVAGDDPTVVYSDESYRYSVTVIDNGDGTLGFIQDVAGLHEVETACEACGGGGVDSNGAVCSECGGTGTVTMSEYDTGTTVTPVFHNKLADGSLSVTKQVDSATTPDDTEFNFHVQFSGADIETGAEFPWSKSDVDAVHVDVPTGAITADGVFGGIMWLGDFVFGEPEKAYADIVGWSNYTANGSSIKWMIDDDGCLHVAPIDGVAGVLKYDTTTSSSITVLPRSPWYASASSIRSVSIDGSVTVPNSTKAMFDGCSNLVELRGMENLDMTSVNSMILMFKGCSSLKSMDISGWRLGNRTVLIGGMFAGCTSLETVNLQASAPTFSGGAVCDVTDDSSPHGGAMDGWADYARTHGPLLFSQCTSLHTIMLPAKFPADLAIGCHYYWDPTVSWRGIGSISDKVLPYVGRDDRVAWWCDSEGESVLYRKSDSRSVHNVAETWHLKYLGGYFVDFNPNGGTGEMRQLVAFDDENAVLPDCSFMNDYEFLGWSASPEPGAEVLYADGGTVPADTYAEGDHVTLYAAWDIPYELQLVDGESVKHVLHGSSRSDTQLPSAASIGAVQFDKRFAGWCAEGTDEVLYVDGDVVPAGTYGFGEQARLVAKWEDGNPNVVSVDNGFDFKLKAGEKITFENVPAGTTYNVYEETPAGWVLVARSDTSGAIEPMQESEALFVNSYRPNEATVMLAGFKTVDGYSADTAGYTFDLYEGEIADSTDLPDGATPVQSVTTSDGGAIMFDTLTFENAGMYQYSIIERKGNRTDMTYDEHVEHVTVLVTDTGEGVLLARAEYDDDGILFDNKMNPGNLTVGKVIDGGSSDQKFMYKVTLHDPKGRNLDNVNVETRDMTSDEAPTAAYKSQRFAEGGDVTTGESSGSNAPLATITADNMLGGVMQLGELVFGEPEKAYAVTDGWMQSGTCEWKVTDGELVIRPLNNGAEGTLASWTNYANSRPWSSQRYSITSVRFEGTVHAPTSCSLMFEGCSNIVSIDFTGFDTSNVTNMQSMFEGCSNLVSLDLSGFDTSNVTNMQSMCSRCQSLTSVDVSGWDVTSVTNTSYMFVNCRLLSDIYGLGAWDTSSILDMGEMFSGCAELGVLYVIQVLEGWNTSNTSDMMVFESSDLNGITSIDVSRVDMSSVFVGQTAGWSKFSSGFALQSADLREITVSSSTKIAMSQTTKAYYGGLYDPPNGFVPGVGYCVGYWCSSDKSVTNLTGRNLTERINGGNGAGTWVWQTVPFAVYDTADGSLKFYSADSGATFVPTDTQVFYGGWDTGVYTSYYSAPWYSKRADIKSVEFVDTIAPISTRYWFYGCSNLTNVDISKLDTSKMTATNGGMGYMFQNCTSLTELDVSAIDMSMLTTNNASYRLGLQGCTNLRELKASDKTRIYYSTTASSNGVPAHSAQVPYKATWGLFDGSVTGQTAIQMVNTINAGTGAGTWVWDMTDGSYAVEFDANGGQIVGKSRVSQTGLSEAEPFEIETSATRYRYIIDSWNTKRDGSGTAYHVGDMFAPTLGQSVTLYAQWVDDPRVGYTVKVYEQNVNFDGYDLVSTDVLEYQQLPSTDVTITPEDRGGFVTPATQTQALAADNSTVFELYYDRTQYRIRYDGNGADYGQTQYQDMIGAVADYLYGNWFSKIGSIFTGWNTSADGTGTDYGPGQSVVNLGYNGDTVNLFAKWLDNPSGQMESSDGEYYVLVGADEVAEFHNLPAGTTYTVEEVGVYDPSTGYAAELPAQGWSKVFSDDASGTVVADDTSMALFGNRYRSSGSAEIHVWKHMMGRELQAGEFQFGLYRNNVLFGDMVVNGGPSGIEGHEQDGEVVFNLSEEDIAALGGAGTYTFTVKEIVPTNQDSSVVYDTSTLTVTLKMADDGMGNLVPTVSFSNNKDTFTNSVQTSSLEIGKTVSNTTNVSKDQEFTFDVKLTDGDGGTVASELYGVSKLGADDGSGIEASGNTLTSVAIAPDGSDLVTFDANGGYFADGNARLNSVATDKSVERVVRYSHTPNMGDDGVPTSLVPYSRTRIDTVAIDGASRIEIDVWFSTYSSTYAYLAIYPKGVTPTTSNYSLATISNGRLYGGYNTISPYYQKPTSEAQHRVYTVSDDTATFFYYMYSSTTTYRRGYGYHATITGFVESGSITGGTYLEPLPSSSAKQFAGWYTDPECTDGNEFDWENYSITGEDVTVYAKWVDGRTPETSTVQSDNGSFSVSCKGGETLTVSNLPVGANYVITERNTPGWEMTGSTGADGQLTAETAKASFANRYSASGEAVIQTTKALSGSTMTAGQFEFGLYDDLGNLLQTATNAADGSVTFDPIAYDESDAGKSFTYYIYEQAGQVPGMTYDTAEHTAVVTVTDNGNGTLSCDVAYDGSTEPSTFSNVYSVGTLDVTKTVAGRNPDPNAEFGFKVTFTDPDGVETVEEFTLGNGQTKRFEDIVAGTTYVVEETDMPFGYARVGIEGGEGTIADGVTSTATVTNRYDETTVIDVSKRWERDSPESRPASISVNLLADSTVVDTVELTADEGWAHRFEGLPVYGDDGETPIVYTVEEATVPSGYEVSYDGYTIINTRTALPIDMPFTGGTWTGIGLAALIVAAVSVLFGLWRTRRRDGE